MTHVTLSNIWAMDSALTAQLERWPFFKKAEGSNSDEGYFANHCPQAEPGSVELTPLVGPIRLSGDTSFGV